MASYFIFWFSCVRKLNRILGTTNFSKISFRVYFFSEQVEGPSDWIMSSFEASSSFCFLKNVRLQIQQHTYEILKKIMGKHFGQTWRVRICRFQSRTRGVAVVRKFPNQNFFIYILTKFPIECDIWSSNQTGAIPTATFQKWLSAE